MIRASQSNRSRREPVPIAICILAGGLSSRMGREKARLRLGGRTLLGHVRRTAATLGLPVRIIRRDLVARCGPIGGVYTSLKTSRAEAELFLACDMPFIRTRQLKRIIRMFKTRGDSVFSAIDEEVGFPFLLARSNLPLIERQIRAGKFSLQSLAVAAGARRILFSRASEWEILNVNTPDDWAAARALFDKRVFRPGIVGRMGKFDTRGAPGKNRDRRPL